MGRLFDSKQFRTDLQLSGSFSGSFQGSGASLTDIPASAIGGLNLSQIASGSFSASISQNGGLSVNTDITSSGTVTANEYVGLPTGIISGSSQLPSGLISSSLQTFTNITASGNISASGYVSASSLNVNDIEAFRLNVTHLTSSFITASTIETSGSNIFGDESSDTHTFIGDIIARNNISSSGYISGSVFSGDGSGLTNIPASGIVGLNLSQISSGSSTATISPDNGLIVNTSISGSIISGSTLVIAPTGSFNHIITDDETIEFRNKSTGAKTGRLKFDASTGLNVQDAGGARTKIRAGRGEFLSLEAGGLGFNSIGPITSSNISSSGIFIGDGSGLTNIPSSGITGLNLSQIASGSVTSSISPDKGFQVNTNTQITGSLKISGSIEIDSLGDNNIIIGSGSGEVLDSGTNNIIFGNNAATSLTTGGSNLIIGHRAGKSTALNQESGNTLIGIGAGEDGTFDANYGDNTFIGYNAGKNSAAQYSTFVGSGVGQGTTSFSVAMGANGTLSCAAHATVALGYNSQVGGTNNYNVAIGTSAMRSSNGGSVNEYNVAIGYQAQFTSYRNYNNIIIGAKAAYGASYIKEDIFIGHEAGYDYSGTNNVSGRNTVIGYRAGYDLGNTSAHNILIGQGVGAENVVLNNQLKIGSGSLATISGSLATGDLIFSNNVTLNGGTLSIKNKGAQSEARFYCEVSNAHYTALKAQPHALYSGNPITLLPPYDLDFAKPNFQANITASANISSSGYVSASIFVGDGSQLSGISTTPFPFSGDAVITGSLTVSASAIDFSNATSVSLPAETIPLINPVVEYVDCGAITSSGTTVPLPNGLTFISSSVYEYIEIFINGLRMRYDVDFAPRSTSTIEYFVTIPSGSEITYKSLRR